jgi:hypothetical protein
MDWVSDTYPLQVLNMFKTFHRIAQTSPNKERINEKRTEKKRRRNVVVARSSQTMTTTNLLLRGLMDRVCLEMTDETNPVHERNDHISEHTGSRCLM